jgi:pSer/pThr/pTyr-binding forkhead associated (FHA) protein
MTDDDLERTAFLGDRRKRAPTPPRLIVFDGPDRGKSVDLGPGERVFGRREDCALVLASSAVSKRHARIVGAANGFSIEDLGSTNGVRLNGKKLDSGVAVALSHGDVVDLSDDRALFLDERAAFEAAAAPAALDREKVRAEADAFLSTFSKISRRPD